MAVIVSGWGTAEVPFKYEEDGQDKYDWKFRIKGETSNPGLPG